MSEPFLAEIKMFAGNFPPKNYAFANGQIMSISQNTALFSLIGTNFGGNGTTNFALPNLIGQVPMGWGQMPAGGNNYPSPGMQVGVAFVSLTSGTVPPHSHTLSANFNLGDVNVPSSNAVVCKASSGNGIYTDQTTSNQVPLAAQALLPFTGANNAHNNMQPYMACNFIVAMAGLFPSRP
jgi:microcystin-dependent protein